MNINYTVTFCFLGQCRGDSFNQIQSGRNWHTSYPVHTVCRKPGLSICSCSYSRFHHLLYSTLPCSPLQCIIYLDIRMEKNQRFINMSALLEVMGKDWCTILLLFYVFTGEDCTSEFKRKGKVAPLKKFVMIPCSHASFRYFFTFVLSRMWSVEFYKKLFRLAFFCGWDYFLSQLSNN